MTTKISPMNLLQDMIKISARNSIPGICGWIILFTMLSKLFNLHVFRQNMYDKDSVILIVC